MNTDDLTPEGVAELLRMMEQTEIRCHPGIWLTMTELKALLVAAAEGFAQDAAVERVRALHYPADNDSCRTPRCPECLGKAGVHECGCWADVDRQPVCGVCNEGHKGVAAPWPCPTIRALDEGTDHE